MKIEVKNKDTLKVSYHSKTSAKYDGHCLRAYSYFPEELPLIHMAEPTEKCFKVTTKDGATYYLSEKDSVKINGKVYPSINDYIKTTNVN